MKAHKTRARLASIVLAVSVAVPGAMLLDTKPAAAASWTGAWYARIYKYNSAETASIADSPFNIPMGSVNPFSWIVPTYRFWWSQTAKTARQMRMCLAISPVASPLIVNC